MMRHAMTRLMAMARLSRPAVLCCRASMRQPLLRTRCQSSVRQRRQYLYRFRDQISDALRVDPFPGRTHGEVAGVYGAEIRHWPYTPDGIAVALVQGAIELVANGASRILRAKRVYAEAMTRAAQRGCSAIGSTCAAKRALQQAGIEASGDAQSIHTVADLAQAIDMLYAACFVVISYLVGPRAYFPHVDRRIWTQLPQAGLEATTSRVRLGHP
jgi:hypothetical protein